MLRSAHAIPSALLDHEKAMGEYYHSTNGKSLCLGFSLNILWRACPRETLETTFWIITLNMFKVIGICISHIHWHGHANYVLHNAGVVHVIAFIPRQLVCCFPTLAALGPEWTSIYHGFLENPRSPIPSCCSGGGSIPWGMPPWLTYGLWTANPFPL